VQPVAQPNGEPRPVTAADDDHQVAVERIQPPALEPAELAGVSIQRYRLKRRQRLAVRGALEEEGDRDESQPEHRCLHDHREASCSLD
jgi:hypothetical protein